MRISIAREPCGEAADLLGRAAAFIEASSFEVHMLWSHHHPEGRRMHGMPGSRDPRWKDGTLGWMFGLGELDGLPVVMSIRTAAILDHPVVFWHMTSVVTDSRMVDSWWNEFGNTHAMRSDAMNFHNVLSHLWDLSGKE